MHRLLVSLVLLTFAPTAYANEPAMIVAVEGPVTLHGQSGTKKRAASRGERLDNATVVSIPKGAMVRLRFNDLRGTEYSLPSGAYTLVQARRLAQGGRTSTFDRVRSFLHVTMGDQVSPIDAAAYLPIYTRTDAPTMNVIWPQEWFGTSGAGLRYSHDGQAAENRAENVGPVVEVPTVPGVTMWVLEGYGTKPALARGFIQRDMQKPADLASALENGSTGERIMAAHEAGYHREAIRLLREERKQDPQPDFVFESALAPRLPASFIVKFLTRLAQSASRAQSAKQRPIF